LLTWCRSTRPRNTINPRRYRLYQASLRLVDIYIYIYLHPQLTLTQPFLIHKGSCDHIIRTSKARHRSLTWTSSLIPFSNTTVCPTNVDNWKSASTILIFPRSTLQCLCNLIGSLHNRPISRHVNCYPEPEPNYIERTYNFRLTDREERGRGRFKTLPSRLRCVICGPLASYLVAQLPAVSHRTRETFFVSTKQETAKKTYRLLRLGSSE